MRFGLAYVVMLMALTLHPRQLPAESLEHLARLANNRFGIQLFKTTSSTSASGNKFLSPLSAYFAISMLKNGAAGETEKGIESALTSGLLGSNLSAANSGLKQSLTLRDSEFEMEIHNGLWTRRDSATREAFRENLGLRIRPK